MHEHHEDRIHPESVVLDIGDDVGALLLYTQPELRGHEIEISLKSSPEERTHVEILERQLESGDTVFAGAYYGLREGDYDIWTQDGKVALTVKVTGGKVTTADLP